MPEVLEVRVPRECHEHIRGDKEQDRRKDGSHKESDLCRSGFKTALREGDSPLLLRRLRKRGQSPGGFETASKSTARVFAVEFFGDLGVYLWSSMVVVRAGQFVVWELKSGGPLHGNEQGARMREEGDVFSSAV